VTVTAIQGAAEALDGLRDQPAENAVPPLAAEEDEEPDEEDEQEDEPEASGSVGSTRRCWRQLAASGTDVARAIRHLLCLRREHLGQLKARDRVGVAAPRSALAAIDNRCRRGGVDGVEVWTGGRVAASQRVNACAGVVFADRSDRVGWLRRP